MNCIIATVRVNYFVISVDVNFAEIPYNFR